MLVMGAYSHSRMREPLLGGVTRHVLLNVAVTPVFMAHGVRPGWLGRRGRGRPANSLRERSKMSIRHQATRVLP